MANTLKASLYLVEQGERGDFLSSGDGDNGRDSLEAAISTLARELDYPDAQTDIERDIEAGAILVVYRDL